MATKAWPDTRHLLPSNAVLMHEKTGWSEAVRRASFTRNWRESPCFYAGRQVNDVLYALQTSQNKGRGEHDALARPRNRKWLHASDADTSDRKAAKVRPPVYSNVEA